jgi:hypothetical protein
VETVPTELIENVPEVQRRQKPINTKAFQDTVVTASKTSHVVMSENKDTEV